MYRFHEVYQQAIRLYLDTVEDLDRRDGARRWFDYCAEKGIEPLDVQPSLMREAGLDRNLLYGVWNFIDFVRDNFLDCDEYRQRWMTCLALSDDSDWEPTEPLDDLPDFPFDIPAHMLERQHFATSFPAVDEAQAEPEADDWLGKRGQRKAQYRPRVTGDTDGTIAHRHEDLWHTLDEMPHIYWENPKIHEITDVAFTYDNWCRSIGHDPYHLSPDHIYFFLTRHPDLDWKFARESMKFALRHVMTNTDRPADYLEWWRLFDGLVPTSNPNPPVEEELDTTERDQAIRALSERLSPGQISLLTFRSIFTMEARSDCILPEVVKRYAKKNFKGEDHLDDRVFDLYPSTIRNIMKYP